MKSFHGNVRITQTTIAINQKTFRSRIWGVVVYGLRNNHRNVRIKVNIEKISFDECPVRFSPSDFSEYFNTNHDDDFEWAKTFSLLLLYASHRHPTVSIVTTLSLSYFGKSRTAGSLFDLSNDEKIAGFDSCLER